MHGLEEDGHVRAIVRGSEGHCCKCHFEGKTSCKLGLDRPSVKERKKKENQLLLGLDMDGIGLPMSQVSKPISWARRQLLWVVIGPRFGLFRPTKKDFNWAQIGPLGSGLEPKKTKNKVQM